MRSRRRSFCRRGGQSDGLRSSRRGHFSSRSTTWCAIVFMTRSLTLSVKRNLNEGSRTGSILEETQPANSAPAPGEARRPARANPHSADAADSVSRAVHSCASPAASGAKPRPSSVGWSSIASGNWVVAPRFTKSCRPPRCFPRCFSASSCTKRKEAFHR